MKIAIIGAGYTGLSMADKFIENHNEVTIYEKDEKVGGMTQNIEVDNSNTDKYYRHLFRSDTYIKDLADKLGVQIKYFKGKMGYYIQNNLYDWGQPITLLTFKPLSFLQKIKFGLSVIKLKSIKDWKELEKYTIQEWFEKNKWEDIYKIVWKPLLNNKFGVYCSSISMAWLWAKINLRKTYSSFNKEILGYIENFQEMNYKMQDYLTKKGVEFYLSTPVNKIEKIDNQYQINNSNQKYDIVISTISYQHTKEVFGEYLNKNEKEKLTNFKYVSAKTMILKTKRRLTDYYWLNIADDNFPFCGIIDYHNMEGINEKNFIYISNYIEKNNTIYSISDEDLLEKYMVYIKKINKDFKKDDILDYKVIKEEYAQPIIKKQYSQEMLENRFKEDGLYINTLPQIYPEDRGVNYAIRNGYRLADEILQGLQ